MRAPRPKTPPKMLVMALRRVQRGRAEPLRTGASAGRTKPPRAQRRAPTKSKRKRNKAEGLLPSGWRAEPFDEQVQKFANIHVPRHTRVRPPVFRKLVFRREYGSAEE